MNKVVLSMKHQPKPWTYATYMEVALYDKNVGYYMRDSLKLGKKGDFYTSNHIHPVFPKTFARFFNDIIQKEELIPDICEWGAGDGVFAYNVLLEMKELEPDTFNNLRYIIIEASPYHRKQLEMKLKPFIDKVKIYSCIDEAREIYPRFEGIVFSNELVDAFPVHVVEKKGEELYEVMLDIEGNDLSEHLVPLENKALKQWLHDYGPQLMDQRFEICLEMKEWIKELSQWICKGMLVTVDYGYSNEEWIAPEHHEGSLRGYLNHELIRDPLQNPGEMDLTFHIQWDAFNQNAKNHGFELLYHETQDRFLVKAGLFSFLQEVNSYHPFSDDYKQNRAIQSLVQPGGISSAFHVNIQTKALINRQEYAIFNEDPYKR